MNKTTIRNIIIALLFMSVSGLVFGFMLYQVGQKAEKLNTQINILAEERARESTYYKLVKTAEETTAQREQLRSHFLLRPSNSIDFLSHVEGLAPQAGVTLKTESLGLVEEKDAGTQWVEVSFVFSGSRERVQRFIQVLENLPYVLRVTSIGMSARSSTDWRVDLQMQVRVLNYDT